MSKKFVAFFLLLLFKILWFDYSWCATSTFRPFSYAETYVFGALLAMLLSLPALLWHKATWLQWTVAILTGLVLLANVLYFRTYFTAIPLSSYGLLPNLMDYSGSVIGSLRWTDALFPLSTLVWYFYTKPNRSSTKPNRSQRPVRFRQPLRFIILTTITFLAAAALLLYSKGGFTKAYEALQDSYTHTCGTPIYTIVGSLYYDYIRDGEVCTPETTARIDRFLSLHIGTDSLSQREAIYNSTNLILILAESFESWVIGKTVEGQEITPCLNRLVSDTSTLYAPHILSQVKGGRSIDAQLMLNTGLLPVSTGVYSIKYPHSCYPSLAKAMKRKYGDANVQTCILTADKPMVWNQNVIAPEFGYDSLVCNGDFRLDEKVGPHYRKQLGDVSLLRQCAEKIMSGEVWRFDGANIVQIVTYSGHFPFALPERLRQVHFSDAIPAVLRDYLTVANYTDRAIGEFVAAIRSDSRFDSTLIVFTGDHEGLAGLRQELVATPEGSAIVAPEPYVPLIINAPNQNLTGLQQNLTGLQDLLGLNPPQQNLTGFQNLLGLKKEAVYGQIDVYPTLLELLGLTDYTWKGLGTSLLSPAHPQIAVSPLGAVYGAKKTAPETERYLKEAWTISDEIIKYNYLKSICNRKTLSTYGL